MTTHYQKIQALGNRMAENLTIMGVPSQFDEGGLTLADKILEISGRVTSGIILYGDKKVAQSEDTVNLYALVLDDNTAVSGETVRFYSDIPLTTTSITSYGVSLGDDYWVSTSSTTNCGIGKGGSEGFIQFNSTTIKIYTSSWSPEYHYTGKFHIKDKVLTYTDMNGETQTIDLTGVATSQSYGTATGPFTVEYFWKDAVTNSEGIATIDYDCTGSGLREFYATSGTFVSETLPVLDTLMFDIATTGKKNNDDWHTQTGTFETPIPVDDNGATLNNTGTGNATYVANKHGTSPSGYDVEFPLDFTVEFDVVDSNNLGNCYLQVQPETGTAYTPALNTNGSVVGSHHRIECTDGKVTVYIDDRQPIVLERSFSGLCSIRFLIGAGTYLKYKNFKVYPI